MGSYCSILTPSLPWCHLQRTSNSMKYETLKPFIYVFARAWERIFIKTLSTEGRCVTGPENVLFAGASVHLSARKCLRRGSEGVNCRFSWTISFDFLCFFWCVIDNLPVECTALETFLLYLLKKHFSFDVCLSVQKCIGWAQVYLYIMLLGNALFVVNRLFDCPSSGK